MCKNIARFRFNEEKPEDVNYGDKQFRTVIKHVSDNCQDRICGRQYSEYLLSLSGISDQSPICCCIISFRILELSAGACRIFGSTPTGGSSFCLRTKPSLPILFIDYGFIIITPAGTMVDTLALPVYIPLDHAVINDISVDVCAYWTRNCCRGCFCGLRVLCKCRAVNNGEKEQQDGFLHEVSILVRINNLSIILILSSDLKAGFIA